MQDFYSTAKITAYTKNNACSFWVNWPTLLKLVHVRLHPATVERLQIAEAKFFYKNICIKIIPTNH